MSFYLARKISTWYLKPIRSFFLLTKIRNGGNCHVKHSLDVYTGWDNKVEQFSTYHVFVIVQD